MLGKIGLFLRIICAPIFHIFVSSWPVLNLTLGKCEDECAYRIYVPYQPTSQMTHKACVTRHPCCISIWRPYLAWPWPRLCLSRPWWGSGFHHLKRGEALEIPLLSLLLVVVAGSGKKRSKTRQKSSRTSVIFLLWSIMRSPEITIFLFQFREIFRNLPSSIGTMLARRKLKRR